VLTLTSEYALRALICLTRRVDDWPLPGKELAREAGVPAKYLSAILGDLVRAGVLTATRGKNGGFRLAAPADETPLHVVLEPFMRFEVRRCPFGNDECSDADPCLAHARWLKVVQARMNFLENTTLHDVSFHATPKRPRRTVKRKTKRRTDARV